MEEMEMQNSDFRVEESANNNLDENLYMQASDYVYQTAKWMNFLFVMSVISIVFMFLGGLGMMVGGRNAVMQSALQNASMSATVLGLAYIIIAGVNIIAAVYIRRAVVAARAAVELNDNVQMVEFLRNTKSLWKFLGIWCIVAISFCLFLLPVITVFSAL